MTGHKSGSSVNWQHVNACELKHIRRYKEPALSLSHSHHPGENKWVSRISFCTFFCSHKQASKEANSKKTVSHRRHRLPKQKRLGSGYLSFFAVTRDIDPMVWQTIDAKKIILISRYYKRIGQTTHLRVWLLTFHMKKETFPGDRTASHRTCGLRKWLHWPGGPGREKPSPFCSQWLSLPWAHVDQDSQRWQQYHHGVPRGISEPNAVAPQAPSTLCWVLTRSTGFTSL